ncbi:MAG: hypothetical protein KDD35_13245, partial [Bdellovibrionales bacterium]|nr:hypothetical protein [Bdellovibrionales bacterium]
GVAMAATLVNLPSQSSGALSDYMLLILPSVGVGVTTVLLEIQFAWPYLNNVFWKHVWKFGGRVMGRVTNIFVNFLYGMSLYGAGVGAAQLPVLFGGNPIAFTHLPFLDAVVAAAVGGLTFHLAMGQFQTDISLEEEHGAIRGSNRYGLETTGAVINNGARVLDWVVPAGLGTWAQMGFFALKTLPQMLKTNFATKIADRRVKEQLRSHQDKPKSWRSRCISAIQSLELINLPKLRK